MESHHRKERAPSPHHSEATISARCVCVPGGLVVERTVCRVRTSGVGAVPTTWKSRVVRSFNLRRAHDVRDRRGALRRARRGHVPVHESVQLGWLHERQLGGTAAGGGRRRARRNDDDKRRTTDDDAMSDDEPRTPTTVDDDDDERQRRRRCACEQLVHYARNAHPPGSSEPLCTLPWCFDVVASVGRRRRPTGGFWWGATDLGGLFLDGRVVLDARAGRQRRRRQHRARGRARAHAAQGVALFVSFAFSFGVCLFVCLFLDFTPHGSRLFAPRDRP